MTSQVALLNRTGVVVASDSISTLISGDGTKPLSNEQKVFEIGPLHKILILNQGNSSVSGVPVQTLIAKWAQGLLEPLDTTFEYLSSFLDYLETLDTKSIPEMQDSFKNFVYSELRKISEAVSQHFEGEKPWWESAKSRFASDDKFLQDYRRRVSLEVGKYLKNLESQRDQALVDEDKDQALVLENAAKLGTLDEMIDLWFPDEVCVKSTKIKLRKKFLTSISKIPIQRDDENLCILAFVGYGSVDMFPSVYSIGIEATFYGVTRWRGMNSASAAESRKGIIYRMAQTDAIDGFLNGFHPTFLEDLKDGMVQAMVDDRNEDFDDPSKFSPSEQDIWRGIGQSVFNRLLTTINSYSEKHKQELESTLGFMGMHELSKVAKSLLDIQILGTLNEPQAPTVGGDVVVANITLESGVVWDTKI